MPNEFSEHGKEIVKSEFIKVPILFNGKNHFVYKYLPRLEDIIFCTQLAKVKSGFTMNVSQAALARTDKEKVSKAFNGILAEMAIHRFLIIEMGIQPGNIKQFDFERDSFQYSSEEYDLMVLLNNTWLNIESRSSISYKTTLEEAFKQYDLLGPYVNEKKTYEKMNDIYFRPLYQYKDVRDRTKEELIDLMVDYYKDKVELYLITGAFKEDFKRYGYIKSMSQGKTKYHVIKIIDLGGMNIFIDRFKQKFEE